VGPGTQAGARPGVGEGERRGEKGRGGAMLQGKIGIVTAGKTRARGWRDAGDCSSDDGAGGERRRRRRRRRWRRACRKRRRVGTGIDGRHGGLSLSAAGAPLPSVLVCV